MAARWAGARGPWLLYLTAAWEHKSILSRLIMTTSSFSVLKEIDRCHDDDADTVDRPTNRSAARRVARSPRRVSA
jgi:hypothetical protein